MLVVLGAVPGLFAEGKIQLKRPTAEPASGSGENPAGAASPVAPAQSDSTSGKIQLTRETGQATQAAPAQDGEYSTSRGPESRPRTLYLGPYFGFNVGGAASGFAASPNANGWGLYPLLGLRSELYFKRIYGIVTDLGYEQNKTYLKETPTGNFAGEGVIRTDYIVLRSMFSYRYSLYKVLGKVKFLRPIADALKPFAGNLQAGFFAKTPLSAQLELLTFGVGDPNDPYYDVKQYSRAVSGGLMAGLGFELRLGAWIFFIDGQYFRGLLTSYNAINSRYFYTDKFTDQGIYFSSGLKTGIYGF
jgi:hypothetical protein